MCGFFGSGARRAFFIDNHHNRREVVNGIKNLQYRRGTFDITDELRLVHQTDTACGHQTDTACAWLVCHSQEGLCKLYLPYPASQEARAPRFLGKPVMRPRIMAGGAPAPCGRVQSRTKTNTQKTFRHTH